MLPPQFLSCKTEIVNIVVTLGLKIQEWIWSGENYGTSKEKSHCFIKVGIIVFLSKNVEILSLRCPYLEIASGVIKLK